MTIVAISRELGSGGNTIAAAVAKALQFTFVDREILLQAAQASGVPEAQIADVDARRLNLWERFDGEKWRYLTFIEAAYFRFAERGNVVTAGRGGPFFLRGIDHALKVKIMAPLDVRIRRVMVQDRVDERTATAKVQAYHRAICGRIDYLFGLDWTQPDHYDLVLNTTDDRWAFYTDLLVAAARHPRYQPTPESLQALHDRSLAVQVRAAIASDPLVKNLTLEVTAHAGQVTLMGVVLDPALMEAALKIARRVPGVTQASGERVEIAPMYLGPVM